MGEPLKQILINKNPWQTRVAIMDDDRLQDVYFDTHSNVDLERCFFKGKISKILPGIQTAFVDIGQERAGFLHITEVDRALAAERIAEQTGERRDPQKIKHKMDISKVFKEGEEVLVQVIKEPVHAKGAKLTTCFTLPGRWTVLMPNIPQIGVSKKISTQEERLRLRGILTKSLARGMGAIIRTTSEGQDARNIERDLAFQIATWRAVRKKFKKAQPGELIHQDLPIALRVVRDHLDDSIDSIIIDDKETEKAVYKFVKNFNPSQTTKIKFYSGPPPLFERFDVDRQIDKALQKKVPLKSGGSLIIEETEALTVIDVNTGRFTGSGSLEETIFKTNIEAAEEVVTQLRLRNIGGLIVIDFIDMNIESNRHKLSRFLEKMLKERDKFQSVALKVSEFGLVQMTRKRSGKTLIQQMTNPCRACNSYGFVKSSSTQSFHILREFKGKALAHKFKNGVIFSVPHEVFDYITHEEYQSLLKLEKEIGCRIIVESNESLEGTQFLFHELKG